MKRPLSLAYLSACNSTPLEAVETAAATGYDFVGLRLLPNAPGAPQQHLIGEPAALRETLAALRDTGVGVFDLEIVRIGTGFDPRLYLPLFEVGAQLGARSVLVAGDEPDAAGLADGFAQLCETAAPFGLCADLEFMPWTAVPNAQAALRVLRAAGAPANAGILVDALHVGRSDTSLADLASIPREWLHYAQICDASVRPPDGGAFTTEELIHTARCERLPPGEGAIDLHGLFSALPDSLPVSVEVVHLARMAQCSPHDWALACRRASLPFL